MKVSVLALAAAAALPTIASAEPYFVGRLGYARADIPLGAPYNGFINDNAPVLGLDVGLGFGEKWAGELGYSTYGSLDGLATPCAPGVSCTATSTAVGGNDQDVVDVALVRRFAIGNVQLYGKAGYYRANIKTNLDLPGADFTEDGALLGIGVRWYLDSPWHVSLEAKRFDDNVSQISVGFGWGLGGKEREPDRVDVSEPSP
jgi:hypothetical protein